MNEENTPTKPEVLAALNSGDILKLMSEVKFSDLHWFGAIIAEIHNEGARDAISFFDDFDWPGDVGARMRFPV